jgi:hypothetical protein
VRSLSSFFLAQEDDNLDGMKELTEAENTAACEAWTRVWRRAVVAQQLGTHPFRLRDAIQEAYQAIMRVREATTHQTETSSPRRSQQPKWLAGPASVCIGRPRGIAGVHRSFGNLLS